MERLGWLIKQQVKRGEWQQVLATLGWMLEEQWWEWRLGIRSEGKIGQDQLEGQAECHSYEALSFRALRLIFALVAPQDATQNKVFLDAGCGKGRALVFASRYPFQSVKGFDLSARLVSEANHNLAKSKRLASACEAAQADARSYAISDDMTTLLLFNPFRGTVLDAFMCNLRTSLNHRPRTIQIVVANPLHFPVRRFPWLRQTEQLSVFHPRMEHVHRYRMPILIFEAS